MSRAEALSFWNQRFECEDYVFGTTANRFLVSQGARLRTGQRVLSVADGEGRNAVWLAEQGLEVDAVEFSPAAVDKARRLAASRGVAPNFHLASVMEWDFGVERYDAVVAIFIQFASPLQRGPLFARMAAALKPGGLLLMQGYTPGQLEYKTGGPAQVEHLYTAQLLRQSFADLELLHLQEHEDVLEEGSGHVGRSALIDLVGRKPAARQA